MADSNEHARECRRYQQRVKEKMPRSKTFSQCLRAFAAGGAISLLGQAVRTFGEGVLRLDPDGCAAFTAIIMVFFGATLTGFGVYDKLGAWAGAGSVVPITGFANSVVSPAMEFKREGLILGTAAKMFTVAGPVLVYGIGSSVVVGILAWLLSL